MSQPYGQHGQPPNYASGQVPYYPPPPGPYNQKNNNQYHQYPQHPQYPPPSAPPPSFMQSQSMGNNGEDNNNNAETNDKFNPRPKYRDLCMYREEFIIINFIFTYFFFLYRGHYTFLITFCRIHCCVSISIKKLRRNST